MEYPPIPIQEALYQLILGDRPVAYLEINADGKLISANGELETFALESLVTGDDVEDQLDFLTGLLDLNNLPIELPFMEMPSGISTDIHIFQQNERLWVLFISAEDKFIQQKSIQQKVNDLSLTFQRQSRILDQYLGKEVARRLEIGMENIDSSGERRNLTMMFADIRGFTSYSEKASPEEVIETLNIYLGAMIPAVLDEQGVIDKFIGDEVMAIFGMLPEQANGAMQGLLASIRMAEAIAILNGIRLKQGEILLQLGIGIATGPVSLGVLGSAHRKSITVIGSHVNLASRLQGLAGPNQLIIDSATYEAIGIYQHHFESRQVELKGFSSKTTIYQIAPGNLGETVN